MSGAIPSFPQYAFMAWCLVKAGGQLYVYLTKCRQVTKSVFSVDVQSVRSPLPASTTTERPQNNSGHWNATFLETTKKIQAGYQIPKTGGGGA